MNKSSIKPFLIECGIISESSIKWTNKVQSPNVSSEISDYAADIYFKGFDGESNVKEVNLIVATWLIAQVNKLGGPENIGTKDREKLITIIAYYKLLEDKDDSGATGFLKNDLNETFEFAKERLEEFKTALFVDNEVQLHPKSELLFTILHERYKRFQDIADDFQIFSAIIR